MPGPTLSFKPVLVGVALVSLSVVVTEGELLTGALLAGAAVPTGIRTYLVLARQRAAGTPISVLSSATALFTSIVLTVGCAFWFVCVALIAAILKDIDLGGLLLLPLGGLTVWLTSRLAARWTAGAAWPDRRGLWRIRLTVRGMLFGVAVVALVFWPVRVWWMRPTYLAIARYEDFVADLCSNESQTMAERAEQRRGLAREGALWDPAADVSADLKVCPYRNDGPAHSWREQAEIWDRAAERSRQAAQQHLNRSWQNDHLFLRTRIR